MILQEVVTQATVAQPSHSHAAVGMWVAIAANIVQLVAIWILIRARGGWTYISTMPMTNIRSLVAIISLPLYIFSTQVVGYFSAVWPPEFIYDTTCLTLSLWAGLEIAGMWIKRKTTDTNIPSTQNMMAAQAASGVAVDARTARDTAAPTARQTIPGQTAEMAGPPSSPSDGA